MTFVLEWALVVAFIRESTLEVIDNPVRALRSIGNVNACIGKAYFIWRDVVCS
jgi:hypothetical protein